MSKVSKALDRLESIIQFSSLLLGSRPRFMTLFITSRDHQIWWRVQWLWSIMLFLWAQCIHQLNLNLVWSFSFHCLVTRRDMTLHDINNMSIAFWKKTSKVKYLRKMYTFKHAFLYLLCAHLILRSEKMHWNELIVRFFGIILQYTKHRHNVHVTSD